jgi:hypothetical protein
MHLVAGSNAPLKKRWVVSYKGLASVREIWLVDSEARWVQVWRRQPDGWTGRDHIGGGSFRSAVLEEAVALDELYLNTGL